METTSPSIQPQFVRGAQARITIEVILLSVAFLIAGYRWLQEGFANVYFLAPPDPYEVRTHDAHLALLTMVVVTFAAIVGLIAKHPRVRKGIATATVSLTIAMTAWDFASVQHFKSSYAPQHSVVNSIVHATSVKDSGVSNYLDANGERSVIASATLNGDTTTACKQITAAMKTHESWSLDASDSIFACMQSATINGQKVQAWIDTFGQPEVFVSMDR